MNLLAAFKGLRGMGVSTLATVMLIVAGLLVAKWLGSSDDSAETA